MQEDKTYTLYTGVLNDDYIERLRDGQYRLVYYTYANEWGNVGHELTGYNLDDLLKYYQDNFGDRLKSEAAYTNEEDKKGLTIEELAQFEDCTPQDILDNVCAYFAYN